MQIYQTTRTKRDIISCLGSARMAEITLKESASMQHASKLVRKESHALIIFSYSGVLLLASVGHLAKK